jgi:predicted acylesterase/phospholipase RssA
MWGLYFNAPDKKEYEYDVATGVSAGAINTGAISLFSPEDTDKFLHFLTDQW